MWIIEQIIKALVQFILSVAGCVIIHEAGHLIGGKLSGYIFSSFELFGIKIIGKGCRFGITLSEKPCIGQCIMKPRSLLQNPVFLILGGIIANVTAAAVFLGLFIGLFIGSFVGDPSGDSVCANQAELFFMRDELSVYLFCLFSAGINTAAAVINMFSKGHINDGYTFADAMKSSLHAEAYNRIMLIYAGLNAGMKLNDMDDELFEFPDMILSSLSAELSFYRMIRAKAENGGYPEMERKRLEKYPEVLIESLEVY